MAKHKSSLPEQFLSSLYFGKDDAESDSTTGGLLKQGFLRTAAYEAARKGQKRLIIGRKGSGKSAICLMLNSGCNDEDYVSLVTPDEISSEEIRRFELPGIPREQSKMLIWRYVFAVQVAKYVVSLSRQHFKDNSTLPKEVTAIRQFLVDNGEVTDLTFHEKFWRIVERVKASISLEAFGIKFSGDIAAPSEGIRASTQLDVIEENIRKALNSLPPQLTTSGMLLLVDQLERVWSNDRDSDLMVVGLLLASKHVSTAFQSVKCVVFLRADIYELLQFQDRDKFRGDEMHIDWKPELLLDLVQARANASLGATINAKELWHTVFPPKVSSEPVSKFIVQRTLMRPRDIIQLCNACRDAAQKNGHLSIEESDIKEAVGLYSNWKLSDLINEYRVNYPFLTDLFVLFSNSSFLVSRSNLEQKLSTIREALTSRYLEYSNVFTIDGILSILYSIGFLGVFRNGTATYVYSDFNTIERNELRFIIHPCFRESLKSISSVDVVPYEPSVAIEDIRRGFSPRRAAIPVTRGSRSFRSVKYLLDVCRRIEFSLTKSNIPDEVITELRGNVAAIRMDVEAISYSDDPISVYGVTQKILKFFSQLKDRFEANTFFEDKKNQELIYTLDEAIMELDRGYRYGYDEYSELS